MNQLRREYFRKITLNHRVYRRIIIDTHYEKKHSDMSDQLILELVQKIENQELSLNDYEDDFEYFVADPVEHNDKTYRLILTTHKEDNFIGVINAFRVRKKRL